jgi:arylsulfatase A-like enzyme
MQAFRFSMRTPSPESPRDPAQTVFCAAAVLAIALTLVKAAFLGAPHAMTGQAWFDYGRSLAAISYADAIFAGCMWLAGRAALAACGNRARPRRLVAGTVVAVSALVCLYAVANVVLFTVIGGFLTYPIFMLLGHLRMLSSSVAAHLTVPVAMGLVGVPLFYIALVRGTMRLMPAGAWRHRIVAVMVLAAWAVAGHYAFVKTWAGRAEWRVSENAPWVLVASWWSVAHDGGTVRLSDTFPAGYLDDFAPMGARASAPPVPLVRRVVARTVRATPVPPPRPPNVVFLVLESVAARWTSLARGPYDTTPSLAAASGRGIVFDNFYAHTGRSSSSLYAMLLSAYPKIDFRDITEEYPRAPGTSLASVFRSHGYRTTFVTSSDLTWAGWDSFLDPRGFEELRDLHSLGCTEPLSSWGVEDRCMIEGILDTIERQPSRPFFVMGWTQQTHHPYEPTPGVPERDLVREPIPDEYNFGRYLNVLRETDRHIGRLFAGIERAGLADDTLVVIVGDHGQAFGYPHNTWMQGRTVYEEDVQVPLLVWFPRKYKAPVRSDTIGGQVDLAPTIAELAGLPAAADWQGRSLFERDRGERAYFYVADDHFALGIRDGRWKYIVDVRDGTEELYDLLRDPSEQRNLARAEPQRCAQLRQRLAAFTEANRRRFERLE